MVALPERTLLDVLDLVEHVLEVIDPTLHSALHAALRGASSEARVATRALV